MKRASARRPASGTTGDGAARADSSPVLLYGVHPVAEILDRRPREVERIFVARERVGNLGRLLRRAREAGIPVSHLAAELLARRIGARAAHQGIAAQVAPVAYADAATLCDAAVTDERSILVLVDRVEDAGNLGAILRTAAAAGARGVLLSTEDTVGLTAGTAKASAGAVERIPVAREASPARRVRWLAQRGFTTVALDPRGERAWDEIALIGRLAVVAGGEARGARPAVLEAASVRVRIPLVGGIESLNVGVSVGVLLFEALRQRRRSSLASVGPGC